MSAIFISHSSHDDAVTAEVKSWLEEQGHRSLFLDFDPQAGIPAGRSWEQELYQQLRSCRAFIVLCSEHSMASRWCFAEITHARSLGKPIFPVKIGPSEVDPALTDRQVIDLTREGDEGFQRLARGLSLAGVDAAHHLDWDGSRPPYPGLLSFQEDDAAVFFGRDREIGAALDLLTQMRRYGGSRLLLLLGASGSGKSSLMRAGMLPRLRRNPEQWLVVDPFRPGERPLAHLASVVAQAFERSGRRRGWEEIQKELTTAKEETFPGSSMIRDLLLGSEHLDAMTVVFIDQFEELLLRAPEHMTKQFLADLSMALASPRGSHLVVATLRSDFLAAFQRHPALSGLQFRTLSLGPMPVESLTEVIAKPAALAGIDMDPALIQALLDDADTEDALPLLAFTLRELWELAQEQRLELGVKTYRDRLGGLRGSVARAAAGVLASRPLAADEEEDLRSAFLGMVRVDDEGHFARRNVGWHQLSDRAHAWLERFVQARLLVSSGDGADRTLEIAHDALFRAWDKLAAWLDENREALVLEQELHQAVRLWEQGGRTDEDLWRGGRLQRALELRDSTFERRRKRREGAPVSGRLPLAGAQLDFLAAAERAERRTQRRRQRLRIAVVAASLLVAAVMGVLSEVARRARDRARTRALAEQARGLHHHRLDLALLLSLEVERRDSGLEARRLMFEGLESSARLETLLHGHAGDVRTVAWSPDSRLLAAGSGGTPAILLWDVASGPPRGRPLEGAEVGVWSLAWSGDGELLAAGTDAGAVLLWDVYAPPAAPRRLAASRPAGSLYAVAWSPDGKRLAAARSDQKIEVWDVAAGQTAGPLLSGATDWLKSLAWSPDGATIAAGGMDKKVRRWDAATGAPAASLRPDHDEGVTSLAYSPDGRLLASGSLDGTVALWQVESGERAGPPLDSLTGAVASVAWSSDARRLAVGSTDGRLVVWDVARRRPLAPLADGQTAALLALAWSPDGRRLASGNGPVVALWRADGGPRLGRRIVLDAAEVRNVATGPDGATLAAVGRDPRRQDLAVRLWNVNDGKPGGVMRGAVRRPPVLAWSGDGRSLLAAGLDRKVRRWEVSTGRMADEWQAGDSQNGRLTSLAWNAPATRLALARRDGAVAIWDLASGDVSVTPEGDGEARIVSLAWSADGRRLASGDNGGNLRLWDPVSAKARSGPLTGHGAGVTDLAWNVAGTLLAAAGRDGTVRLWDAEGRPAGEPLAGHGGAVVRLAWSADGRSLAAAGNDRRILIWDVESRTPWAGPFAGHSDTISGLWFSADATTLTSVSVDGTLRHWDVDPASWRERACRIANRNLTRDEWRRYLPFADYRETCRVATEQGGTEP